MAGIYNFVIDLKDQVTPDARKAQESIDELSAKIRDNREAVLGMNAAMRQQAAVYRQMEAPTTEQARWHKLAMGNMRDEKAEMLAKNQRDYIARAALEDRAKATMLAAHAQDTLNKSLKEQNQAGGMEALQRAMHGDLLGAFKALHDTAKSTGETLEKHSAAMVKSGQTLPVVSSALSEATIGMMALGAAAIVGAGALTAFAFEGAKVAIEATEAKEAALALFSAMGEGRSTGAQVLEMFDELGPRIGQTREEMIPLARQFEAMGLHSVPELEKAMLAAGRASGMMGAEGGRALATMMGRITEAEEAGGGFLKMNVGRKNPFAAMGVDIDDVARKMGVTSAALGAMLKGGTADARKFGDALEQAITEKGAGPTNRLAANFESTSKRMHASWTEMFEDVDAKPLLDEFGRFAELFDKNTASGTLFRDLISGTYDEVMKFGGGALSYLNDCIENSTIDWLNLVIAMHAVEDGIGTAWDAVSSALSVDYSPEGHDIGNDVGQGLVDGMMAKLGDVDVAGRKLGQAGVDGARTALDSHSPSRKMAEVGGDAADGFGEGWQERAPANGIGGLLSHIRIEQGSFPSPVAANSNSSRHIEVHASFNFSGSGSAAIAAELTEEAVALIFERVAGAQGL